MNGPRSWLRRRDKSDPPPLGPVEPAIVDRPLPPRPVRREPPAQTIAFSPSSVKRTTFVVLALLILASVGLWAFQAMSTFLFLLLLAWLLSIAMEPPVLWMVKRGVKRGLATGIVLIVGVLVTIGLIVVFGGLFLSQISDLGTNLPGNVAAIVDWVNATFRTDIDPNNLLSSLNITPASIGDLAGRYGGGLLGIFGSLVTFLFDGLTILVFAYYLSADSPRLRQTIGSWLPQAYQRYFVTVWEISVEKTGGYVVSKGVLAALSAFSHAVFFAIIGIPYWLPLGVLAGIVGQFIPTIGTYIGIIIPAVFALLDQPIDAVWIVVFATIYQQLENYVFTPRISRRTMDVHPAVALGSVIAGAALFGPIGALIGIPLAAAALAILETFSRRHRLLPELASLEDAESNQDEQAKAVLEHHQNVRRDRGEADATQPADNGREQSDGGDPAPGTRATPPRAAPGEPGGHPVGPERPGVQGSGTLTR